jgi:hypothetical protein
MSGCWSKPTPERKTHVTCGGKTQIVRVRYQGHGRGLLCAQRVVVTGSALITTNPRCQHTDLSRDQAPRSMRTLLCMTRPGRLAEQVVALFEAQIGGPDVVVTSPDHLPGRNSGVDREVDVTIRARVGSSDVLVIFECRDRASSEDVTWPEQVRTKREDVGADKAVIVSTSGFSGAARRTARAYGIELRTLSELDPVADLVDWVGFREMTMDYRRSEVVSSSWDVVPEDLPDEDIPYFAEQSRALMDPPNTGASGLPVVNSEALILTRPDGSMASLNHVWLDATAKQDLYRDVPIDGSRVRRHVRLNFTNEEQRYAMVTPDFRVRMEGVRLEMDLWVDRVQLPTSALREYRDGDVVLAQSIEVTFDWNGQEGILVVTNVPGKSIGIDVR